MGGDGSLGLIFLIAVSGKVTHFATIEASTHIHRALLFNIHEFALVIKTLLVPRLSHIAGGLAGGRFGSGLGSRLLGNGGRARLHCQFGLLLVMVTVSGIS